MLNIFKPRIALKIEVRIFSERVCFVASTRAGWTSSCVWSFHKSKRKRKEFRFQGFQIPK